MRAMVHGLGWESSRNRRYQNVAAGINHASFERPPAVRLTMLNVTIAKKK